MSILAQLLFGWILSAIAVGYNPVTLTQNGVYIGQAQTHAAAAGQARLRK